ncbi:Alpha/beta hydrolase fold-3 [Penicillium chermesinum]|uniref:Alpha/beta hydrolase fold-3 n=1 Tax=Penicillium chermesinum TaxID=63820 RepID=A0A9W9NPS5_9EURO|nr:Alpha/beta hydrolase fold-3 [Penicillium chermesinum]KAJ5223874.1 Alpha/beta hydrolase fold-3 [Penicillium chermesinum]
MQAHSFFLFFWAVATMAQFAVFSPAENKGLTFSVHVPDSTANNQSGPIYIQLNSTKAHVEWFALGQGSKMAGSNIFVVYRSGNNVTVSPRTGVGHVEPLYNQGANVTVMDGSGAPAGMITANIRCDNCLSWSGGKLDLTSASSSWIWAIKYGKPLFSTKETATIKEHDQMGVMQVDLKPAIGKTSSLDDPFADVPAVGVVSGPTFDEAKFRREKIAHGVIMTVAFVGLFPFSALLLHLSSASSTVATHGALQLFNLGLAIAGLALGIIMARDIGQLTHHHPIIGFVVVCGLALFQPIMGFLQHRFYRKTGGKGPFAYLHRWLGRVLILLGVVNVFLGFVFVGVGDVDAPRGAVIAVGVVSAVLLVFYFLTVGANEKKRRRRVMPLHTVALGAALTPTVIRTLIDHYIHRKAHHTLPTVHITYDEGLHIIRAFIYYASKHPVEDMQAFTRQTVPSPHWVRTESVTIPEECLSLAADALCKQLGPKGLLRVGGEKWWQWRGPPEDLKAEWIEMRSHYNQIKKENGHCNRIMLYIHGGAYFFGSLETHRYMMQRHARKLKGRVFAPAYRLAPQYPFPCGLQDCIASYLWLLKSYDPKEIILAGDSAGGGMVLSMLVTMRDQDIPLPAGGILISPWVDLTHSFPSLVEDHPGDYIPPYGFRYKPSAAWPPPNSDDLLKIKKLSREKAVSPQEVHDALPAPDSAAEETAVRGYTLHEDTAPPSTPAYPGQQQTPDPKSVAGQPDNIRVFLDGKTVELKDQIQLYTTNQLISHPLVSPILSGGGELLRDEQFYIAHKAANPTAYPPSDVYLDEHDPTRETLNKYEPTYVHLQVWDNLCHVAPTLSFTRPAKYMFRAISQFGSWALARAQNAGVEIIDDAVVSPISSSGTDTEAGTTGKDSNANGHSRAFTGLSSVGKAGDPLPAFHEHMIRERVDKRGRVYPLDPPSSYPVLQFPREKIGSVNPELIRKWLVAKNEWDQRFAKEKLRVQRHRIKEMAHGFQDFGDEVPAPSSLAARRAAPGVMPKHTSKKNYGMMLWSGWGSKHDEHTIEREKKAQKAGRPSTRQSVDAGQAGAWSSQPTKKSEKEQPAKDHQSSATNGAPSGAGAVTWDASSEKKPTSGPDIPADQELESRPLSQKSNGPILVLPDVDNRKMTDETASTRALFHAPGTLGMRSDASLAFHRSRPSSPAGDDSSTIGGERDSLAMSAAQADAVSTRAVLSARGVSKAMNADENGRPSVDTASTRHKATNSDASQGPSSSQRPNMPDRGGV